MLTDQDLAQLKDQGLDQETLNVQIERFKKGFAPLQLSAAATVSNGIQKLSEEEIADSIITYESYDASVLKFVPASGAASRMFKGLFGLLDMDAFAYEADETAKIFFTKIKDFAFHDDLKAKFEENTGNSFESAVASNDKRVIATLLQDDGLAYGSLPKGLLRFHTYKHEVKTPVQEHISEGIAYAQQDGKVSIHFTVSPDHQERFEQHVSEVLAGMGADIDIQITYSTQKNSTDTVAVDPENELFRQDDGSLLFRPAGHGALLENLNQLDADLIFIKNIDNVVPDRIKSETIRFKKVLAGVLLNYQQQAFDLLKRAGQGEDILQAGTTLLEKMGCVGSFSNDEVVSLLDRPFRVCGMVKNEGEPGGGPFWVESHGKKTLQIVESAQVNEDDPAQKSIFTESTHFNPVDLVCGLKNYEGKSFDLLKYRDDDTGFVTEKSSQGRQLKAMELPGLWNGSMAHWNTIFVEVPLITFNPVKTVMDLLKDNHQ